MKSGVAPTIAPPSSDSRYSAADSAASTSPPHSAKQSATTRLARRACSMVFCWLISRVHEEGVGFPLAGPPTEREHWAHLPQLRLAVEGYSRYVARHRGVGQDTVRAVRIEC